MSQSHYGLSAEAEEPGGCANGSDDESSNGGMKGSPRRTKVSSSTKGWRLRGVEWRVKLGVLPGNPASVDAMRRTTADGRRRYADLRRRLLVDPHSINGDDEEDTSMDNPLSLDPESIWGRYFRNAELEKTIDKDLTRLYPEHGIFFQSTPCQKMMRRILLVWSLIHPQFSYRQGMHELLAPLLYVLHVDVVRLSQVKHRFEDLFDDRFDSLSLQEEHVRDKVESAKKFVGEMIIAGDSINFDDKGQRNVDIPADFDEKRVDLSVIVHGSDMYGVEGELGALLSARFLEHDAYCMLDALLIGQGGAVSMAAYFSPPPGVNVPPVIEASASLYRTLAAADISLYTHLVELGVEPQFFALRWLRLLFGREFILEDLLRVWDAILAADNTPLFELDGDDDSCILRFSQRSALISSTAVSMLLYVRPALLAAPDATACLQRLLNFPQVPDVRNLIETAKSLQLLAQAAERAPNPTLTRSSRASEMSRNGKHARSGSISPPTTTHHVLRHQKSPSCSPDVLKVSMSLPGSYWEEKWTHSVLQKKSPEELFSPRASKLDAVTKNQENIDRDTTLGMLCRSVSEGRHQISRLNTVAAQSTSNVPDRSPDSSDGEGQEMLGRSEKVADKAFRSKDSSAESVASTSDCDGSRDSDSERQEVSSHHRLSTDEEGSVTSTRTLKLSRTDTCADSDAPRSPQTKKIIACDASGSCDKPDERKKSGGAEACWRRVSADPHVASAGSGCTLESDMKPSNLSSSTPDGLESEAARMGSESECVFLPVSSSNLPLHDESNKVKSRCVADSKLRVDVVSSTNCGDPEVNLKLQDAESTRRSPPPFPTSANEGEGGDHSVVEDISRSVDSPPLPPKPKGEASAAQPARSGRLNWMWSLGRTSSGERTTPNKVDTGTSIIVPSTSGNASDTEGLGSPLASGMRKPKRWWRSNNDVVPEECVATTSSDGSITAEPSVVPLKVDNVNTNESVIIGSGVLQKEDVSMEAQVNFQEVAKKPKDKTPSAALQALGQAMLEHVQVLESSLAQKASVLGMETMMWTPAVRDKSESTRNSLGVKSQAAALAAIAELRKISNALQQM